MSEQASQRRKYDTTKRAQHAERTRARIVTAAGRLFVERGYTGTTIPQIAAEAGVAVETVYRSASGKAGLLAAAVQAALAGGVDRSDVPVDQRPGIRRVIEETDPARQLWYYADTQPGVWSRVGPLLRVLDAAASADSTLAELRERHVEQRLTGLRRFAQLLADRGALRADVTVDRATDIIFTICAQANYDSLVTARNWTHDQYRDWLAETLAHCLLP